MVTRVFGTVDGTEVVLERVEGNRWNVPVPLDRDGEYVVEIIAEDDAGNRSYIANMLYTVEAGNICIHVLPLKDYIFSLVMDGYQFDRVFPSCEGVAL